MRKFTQQDKNFLESFSKSDGWISFRDLFLTPLIGEVEKVNGDFKFPEGFTAGEKYAGRKIASQFGSELIILVDSFLRVKKTEKKPEDNFN